MAIIPKEKIAEVLPGIKVKAGKQDVQLLSATVAGERHEIIAKVPGSPEFQAYRDMLNDESKRTRARDQLVRDCILYPDSAGLDTMLEKLPGLGTTFGNKLSELAGAVEDVEAKKL